MKFKMAPFRCAECGTEQLVDKAKVAYEGEFMVISEPVLHVTDQFDPHYYRQFNHMGRYDLMREILRIRKKNK